MCEDQVRCGRKHLVTTDSVQASFYDKAKAAFDAKGSKRRGVSPAGVEGAPKAKKARTKG